MKLKKSKTKPIQSQFKAKQSQFFGGFWRKNFNFSLKIDDTKLNFLCKTNPMVCYSNLILSPKMEISTILQNLFMQNEPNGMLFKTNLFLSSTYFEPVSQS